MKRIAGEVYLVDVWQFGRAGLGGVYLIRGEGAALVEAGTSLAVPRILTALEELGISRGKVRWIFVTHVHLDHAGGAGVLVRQLPQARVVVHPRGARHLADPRRLLSSVRQAVGDRFPLYGEAIPIPEEQLYVPEDGEVFPVGKHRIRAVDAPGHAPHHLCFFEETQGLLFTGDAAGLWLDGRLFPATVPPSFDLELSLATLERISALDPKVVCYTHFGPRSGAEGLREYAELLLQWLGWVRDAWQEASWDEGTAVKLLLEQLAREGWPVHDPLLREDLLMSAQGVLGYLKRREAEGA
ncbi:MAG TPA: MBL fold metallo-hydrolase [Candidatus Acetothermia bacterium]|nr:MBL fold metallo-hydrolase [Candidatus Acetothermia bacterium]